MSILFIKYQLANISFRVDIFSAKELEGEADSLDAYMACMKDRLDNATERKVKSKVLELKKVSIPQRRIMSFRLQINK